MRIAALTKTFRGEESLEKMFLSIKDYIDKIVFVNSEVSWMGRKGNTCKEVIKKLDSDKVISLDYDTMNQLDQCMYGYNFIKENLDCDLVMLIDTDEVWDRKNLDKAIEIVVKNPDFKTYTSRLYTYIKTPFYRVEPPESIEVVVFVKPDLESLGENSRCYGLTPKKALEENGDVYFHHFIYVRGKFNDVLEKVLTSHISENTEYRDMSWWIPNVWEQIPHVNNFHPAKGFEHHWERLKRVEKKDLPEVFYDL